MIIYKIINKINNKIYIGQTTKTFEQRFKRHISDSLNYIIDTKFSRAIRKYGKDNFIGYIIDTATTQKELDNKECYWIKYYNSVNLGYNMTDGAINANTYKYKTDKEMKSIKNKIRITKLGSNNPHAVAIKCKNIKTMQELIFNSCIECSKYFNLPNHNMITRRCTHKTKCLLKKEWLISYVNEEYIEDFTFEKNNNKSKSIIIYDILNKKYHIFESFASAERFFKVKPKHFSGHAYKLGANFTIDNQYKITILN